MSKKKQTVLKVDINCADCQKEIFAKVGKLKGVQSLVVDPEKKTLTVVGSVEPAPLYKALKKIKKNPEILTVGAPKPKCKYCKYFVCACGIARFPAKQPTELAPPPPGWCVPPPCTEDSGCCPPPPYYNNNNQGGRGWFGGPSGYNHNPRDLTRGCFGPQSNCDTVGDGRGWSCPPPEYPGWCPQPSTPYPCYTPHDQPHCELVAVYPRSPDRPGQCSIV